jgi:mono/diheme cytochrome c family protein
MKVTILSGTRVALLVATCVGVGAAVSAAQAQDAKQVYEKSCVMCHGAGGKGDGPASKAMKPPPQPFATGLSGTSDADIAKVIKEGGKAVGKAASMPAYGSKLSDEQIQGLVQYIKGLK